MPDEPVSSNGSGRDSATGRFLHGHGFSKGRPSRPSLWRIARERAEAAGVDLEHELWQVVQALLERAKAADVAAARVLFDELTLPIADELEALVARLETERT